MEPLIIYLLKANVVLSILFLFYLLALKNDKSFLQNRFYLLLSLMLSLVFPFLPYLSFSHFGTLQHGISTANPLNNLYASIDNSQNANITADVSVAYAPVKTGYILPSPTQILVGIYLLISLAMLVMLIIKLLRLGLLIKKTDKQFTDGIYYCDFDQAAPFSFFRYLVVNKQLYNDDELQQIISHEKIHIRQWHSIDIVFAELVHAILWINPLMVYIKRAIRLNHEYIADAEVISSGIDKKNYQLSILHSSLKLFPPYQLTNLYSSSKIKLRIKMMNLKKPTKAASYKYAFVLLLVIASYFLINPSGASTLQRNAGEKTAAVNADPLKAFEGLYKMPGNNAYIKLTEVNNALVVKEMWSGNEYLLKQKSELEFATSSGGPFKFTKDKSGKVTRLLAFEYDTWLKANSGDLKEVKLNTQQLKALEGIYQSETNKAAYVQVVVKQNSLITKQLWDGKEISMSPKSDVSFFVQNPLFNTVEFVKNGSGNATKFRASAKGDWIKVDNYKSQAELKLPAVDLKKFEGYYEFKNRKGQFLQIIATTNGLVLKQLWDYRQVDFKAVSSLGFSTKEDPWFTLQFTADNSGGITQLLAFGKDVWVRSNNYHPPVAIQLPAQDLKKFEGKYQQTNRKDSFIQISAANGGIVLKQSWDNKQIDFSATGPSAFFAKNEPGFTLQFTGDNSGDVTQVLAFGQDVWIKLK